MAPIDLISCLVSDELTRRGDRLLERRRKQAAFRDPLKTLDNFDFHFNPKMNRSLVFDLATCAFIAKREDGSFLGPGGTGKSHLAQAIGQSAILQGYRVLYRETHVLLDELAEAVAEDAEKRGGVPAGIPRLDGSAILPGPIHQQGLQPEAAALGFGLSPAGGVRAVAGTGCESGGESMICSHSAPCRGKSSARQGSPQIVLGIPVAARKLRTGELQDGFHLSSRHALRQQTPGNPQVHNAPVRLMETLPDMPSLQTVLVDRVASAAEIGARRSRWMWAALADNPAGRQRFRADCIRASALDATPEWACRIFTQGAKWPWIRRLGR
jgi:hypothetical protein